MAIDTRRRLHALLDQLQGDELVAAQAYLEFLITRPDHSLIGGSGGKVTTVRELNEPNPHQEPLDEADASESARVPDIWHDDVDPVEAAMDAAPEEDEELSPEEQYKLSEATQRGSGLFRPHISHDDLGRLLDA